MDNDIFFIQPQNESAFILDDSRKKQSTFTLIVHKNSQGHHRHEIRNFEIMGIAQAN